MNREIEQSIDLQRAIADLPPRQYRVVTLWLQGYKQREIGLKLGIKQPTVSYHLAKVRKSINLYIFFRSHSNIG